MGRLAISAGIAAALVVTAVAVGAGSDVRIHRLHLPPPPAGDELGSGQPPATTDPSGPGVPSPPAPPSQPPPPGAQPPPPAPPPPSVVCSTGSAATPDATGTLDDYTLSLTVTTFSSAAGQLTFRGMNVGLDTHTIAIKTPGPTGTTLCATAIVPIGASSAFTITGLTPGSYVIFCTIHPVQMQKAITVS